MIYTPPQSNPKYKVWTKVNFLTESVVCATFGVRYSGEAVYLLIGADHRVPCGFHFIECSISKLSFLQHVLKNQAGRDPIQNLTDAVTDGTASVPLPGKGGIRREVIADSCKEGVVARRANNQPSSTLPPIVVKTLSSWKTPASAQTAALGPSPSCIY